MINELFKVTILQSYIRRLWTWLECFGIVLAVLGIIFLYDQTGLLDPLRKSFSATQLKWWSMLAFSAAVGCIVAAVMIGLMINKAIVVKVDRQSNPRYMSEQDIRKAIVEALLAKIHLLESLVWMLSACPAFLGAALFAVGRSAGVMLLYLGITLLTGAIFLPSLYQTEKLVDKILARYASQTAPEDR